MRPVALAIWGGIQAMGQGIATVFDATLGALWRFLTGWYKGAMSGISPILYFAGMVAWGLGFMVGTILRAWNWIKANPIVSGLLFVSLAAFAWPLISSAAAAVWSFATNTVAAGARAAWGFLTARIAAIRTAIATAWMGRSAFLLRAKIVAVAAVTKAWAAFQWLLNAAMTANPIGIVVGLVALLAAGFVLLYTKVEPVRTFLDGLWDGFKSGLNWVIDQVNSFIGVVNKIPGVEIPLIPTLDTGAAAKAMPMGVKAPPAAGAGGGALSGLVAKDKPMAAQGGMSPAVGATGPLSAVLGDAPRGGKLAAAAQGGYAAAMPADVTPARPTPGTQPARAITRNQQTTTVDRRIHVAKIEVQAPAGTPATSIKDQLLEALREAAGQEDGIDGASYAQ